MLKHKTALKLIFWEYFNMFWRGQIFLTYAVYLSILDISFLFFNNLNADVN